jgi:hypothetical protein
VKLSCTPLVFALFFVAPVSPAEEVGCTSTTFRVFGANDKSP